MFRRPAPVALFGSHKSIPERKSAPPRSTLAKSGKRSDKPRGPGLRDIPIIWPQTHDAVITDCVAGVKATRIAKRVGYEFLTLGDGFARVDDVQKVRSVGKRANYYFLTITLASGKPLAIATVDEIGWLNAVRLLRSGVREPASRAGSAAVARARAALLDVIGEPELVFGRGTMFHSELDPLWSLRTSRGDAYVDADGGVFVPDAMGSHSVEGTGGIIRFRKVH